MRTSTTNTISAKRSNEEFDQQELSSTADNKRSTDSWIRRTVAHTSTLICLSLLFALFLAPMYQLKFEPIPRKAIKAIYFPSPRPPKFSWPSFLSGDFQKRFDEWFLKRHGLYGYIFRLSNELTYRVFDQVSLNYGTTVLVGNDKQLFQPMYLAPFNKQRIPEDSVFEKRAKELQRLQTLLKERGIASTLLVSTNVMEFYPELIPSGYVDPTRESRKSSYEKMRPLLDKYNLNYIDGHELLSTRKADYEYRFFQSTASHWNQPAWCLVTQSLTSQLSQLLEKPLPEIVCHPIKMSHRALGRDHDLLDITNLYFVKDTYRPAPYVYPPKKKLDPSRYKPRILFIGTSFSMTITEELLSQGVTNDVMLFFYYAKYRPGNGGLYSIDHANMDWENAVLSYDAVVIEANVAGVGDAGFKFPTDLLAYLDGASK